ncbi:MAG: hypothetical protein HXS46_12705 [Theionarchaea archaeon]|nr:MAG: hypothetical protein AYK18_04480 [Theionarchaea archaeon DG-70]MBU7011542.1 hypothetical protein [Theionarchaea archaeon]
MKYSWIIVLIILITGCIGQGPSEGEPEQSEPNESAEYTNLTDEEILALIEQSSPVVLYWYSSLCSSCHTVKPLLKELQEEYNLDIIWVDKKYHKSIFELYNIQYYPSLYVYDGESEVFFTFDENDSLTRTYSLILDKTMIGMHHIECTAENNQITIPFDDLLPDRLYYTAYNDHRIFIFISVTGRLFVFARSRNCPLNWLYLKKDLIYDGENPNQWDRKTLGEHGGGCGPLLEIPYSVTGSAIIINTEDIRW